MGQNVIQVNGGIKINVDVSVKSINSCGKEYAWNPGTCHCETGKYLYLYYGLIICDEIIEIKKKEFYRKKI